MLRVPVGTQAVKGQARHHRPGHDDVEVVGLGGDFRRGAEMRDQRCEGMGEQGQRHAGHEAEDGAVPKHGRG